MRLWQQVRQWLPWKVVRIFGSLSYFNISYGVLFLVPIVHELYARSVPIMTWFGAPSEFPSTLEWIYAASLCYAGAILLYQIFCPSEIKRLPEEADYLRDQFEMFQRTDPHHRVEIVLARLHSRNDERSRAEIERLVRFTQTAASASERAAAQSELDALLDKLHAHAVQAYLSQQHEQKNLRFPIARWLSLALYVAGTIIVVVLLIIRSVEVFRDYREGSVLIKTEMQDSEMILFLAYSFQASEFDVLQNVLARARLSPDFSPIGRDRAGREGRRYYLRVNALSLLTGMLGGDFDKAGQFFVPTTTGPSANNYACREMKSGGRSGKGCQNIHAADDASAMVACSLVAGRNGWFYGTAEPGSCSSQKSSLRLW